MSNKVVSGLWWEEGVTSLPRLYPFLKQIPSCRLRMDSSTARHVTTLFRGCRVKGLLWVTGSLRQGFNSPVKGHTQEASAPTPELGGPCCLHTGLGAGAVPSLALRQPSLNPSPGLSPGECGQAAKLALLTSRAVMGHTWPAYTGPRTLLSRYHLDVGGWASLDSDYEDKPVPESYMTTSTLTPL